jgi:CAAX protease family protein
MKRRGWTLSTTSAAVISCAAALGGFVWLTTRGISISNSVVLSLCGGAVLAGMLILGSDDRIKHLQQALTVMPFSVLPIMLALWGLYFLYSAGMHTARSQSLIFMAVYLWLPFLLLSTSRGLARGTWLDAVTILLIWLPLELGIVRRILITSTPNVDFHYGFAEGLAINMGIVAFAAWRGLPGIGYRFEFDRKKVGTALLCFLLFGAVAIPLGLAIHFIHYSFALRKLLIAPAAFVGIYLFTAIPEELLFRGLIQNWFERIIGRRIQSLLLASIIFGASHLNNGPPIPNYKYFLMASIAGLFYGFVWQRTGSLAVSAITHALVDAAWSVLFR